MFSRWLSVRMPRHDFQSEIYEHVGVGTLVALHDTLKGLNLMNSSLHYKHKQYEKNIITEFLR